jgi:peptidylprolyl isomerase
MNTKFITAIAILILISTFALIFFLNKGSNTLDNLKKDKVYYDNLTELEFEDLVVGTGETVVSGMNLKVNYKGYLTDGKEFDSSYKDGREPFLVSNVGNAQVIAGWNEGMIGMKVGGKRKLYVPADKGYASREITAEDGSVLIPSRSTLIFEIELLEIVPNTSTTSDSSTSTSESQSSTSTEATQ